MALNKKTRNQEKPTATTTAKKQTGTKDLQQHNKKSQ